MYIYTTYTVEYIYVCIYFVVDMYIYRSIHTHICTLWYIRYICIYGICGIVYLFIYYTHIYMYI